MAAALDRYPCQRTWTNVQHKNRDVGQCKRTLARRERRPGGEPPAPPGARARYWQASQYSGFSSEQASASAGVYCFLREAALDEDRAMRVAGRDRR